MKMKRREFLARSIAGMGGVLLGTGTLHAARQKTTKHDPYELVTLGKTKIKVSRVGFGTGMSGGNKIIIEPDTPVAVRESAEMDRDLIEKAFIVLGDQFDLSEKEEVMLGEDARKISLGPRILHTDHCVILIHNALDIQSQ